MAYGKLSADTLEHSDGTIKHVNSLIDGNSKNKFNFDNIMMNANKGLIMIDRGNSKQYRLFIENGNLGIEEV